MRGCIVCGIIGYIGVSPAVPILVRGLQRLEYRGYDSAGIAVIEDQELFRVRDKGKVATLAAQLENSQFSSTIGMGHTRWATHGEPSRENSHPHASHNGSIMVVHNGIIENYYELREQLRIQGYKFTSETDTEIVAHLIEDAYDGDLLQAVKSALHQVQASTRDLRPRGDARRSSARNGRGAARLSDGHRHWRQRNLGGTGVIAVFRIGM